MCYYVLFYLLRTDKTSTIQQDVTIYYEFCIKPWPRVTIRSCHSIAPGPQNHSLSMFWNCFAYLLASFPRARLASETGTDASTCHSGYMHPHQWRMVWPDDEWDSCVARSTSAPTYQFDLAEDLMAFERSTIQRQAVQMSSLQEIQAIRCTIFWY